MANSVYPDTPILMIEGNRDNAGKLTESLDSIQETSPKSRSMIAILSDKEKIVTYYKPNQGSTSGSSIYRENTIHYSDTNAITEERPTLTLDQLLNDSDVIYDLIKMDVQGSEYDIIKGGASSIEKARFVLLEAQLIEYNRNAPLINDIIQLTAEHGFIIADIYDLHYLPDGRLNEIDVLFARKDDPIFSMRHNHSFEDDADYCKKYDICIARSETTKKSLFKKITRSILNRGNK